MSISVSNKFKKIVTMFVVMFCLLMNMSATAFAEGEKSEDLGSLNVKMTSGKNAGLNISGAESFNTKNDGKGAWNNFFEKYKKFIVGISGIGAITMVGCFIFCFMKLGASSTNPQARQQALTGVLWSGVAAAGLGAVTIIVGFFYSAFK